MVLWKITDKGVDKIPETKFKSEKLLEENLEEWIANSPDILGEPLLIVGRQVQIPDTRDRLDLLALDSQGFSVIIELKRGDIKDPVDVQSLRYASYINKWSFEDFESVARNFHKELGNAKLNFNEMFETFCEESRGEVPSDFNSDQRIIIVGSAVREKLGSVALWLRDHGVDIKLIEVRAYKDESGIVLEPKVLVPLEVSKFKAVGKIKSEGSPWITDGRIWHLEKRCSAQTKDMLIKIESLIDELVEIEGTYWNQKSYVAFRKNNFNWLAIHTHPTALVMDVNVKAGSFKQEDIAKMLNIVEFDRDESLSEKLNLPSSVFVKSIREHRDRIRIRIKEDFNIESASFKEFIKKAFKECPK